MPVAFSGAAQCTSPLTMIPDQTATSGQLTGWAQTCATQAQDSGLRATSSVNALQNAAKLYFAAGNYNLAAENGAAAKRLWESLPSSSSNASQDARFKFDSAFVTIAPSLALGLSDNVSNRTCGSQTACLTSGLEALEAVEFATVRPRLNDTTRYYQRAAANLQTMNAKANAALSETGADGNVDKSLSILKSIISMAPAAGNEALSQQATATLLDIAESSSARALKVTGGTSAAIRYLTEAAQIAPVGDRKRGVYSKLGAAHEARADSMLGNADASDDATALTDYCDAAKAYQLASGNSDKLISLGAMEGYAYALSQIELAGSSLCNATLAGAI